MAPWGVTILSVEVRDILLPKELQEAMSLEAQAEQRKKARIILMEAEHDIYEILDEMEELIGDHEAVARLRTMHLLNESLREGKGTVVIPSAFAEGFNEGLGDLLFSSAAGITALALRIAASYALRGVFWNMTIAYAEAISWALLLALYAFRLLRRRSAPDRRT